MPGDDSAVAYNLQYLDTLFVDSLHARNMTYFSKRFLLDLMDSVGKYAGLFFNPWMIGLEGPGPCGSNFWVILLSF